MDYQVLFNIVFGAFSALLGFVLKSVWDSVKDLYDTDKELVDKVHAIEVLVTGKYPTREEMMLCLNSMGAKIDKLGDNLGRKLDLLVEKVEGKMDKDDCDRRCDR